MKHLLQTHVVRKAAAISLSAALLLGTIPAMPLRVEAQTVAIFPTPTASTILPTITPTPNIDPDATATTDRPAHVPGELLVGVHASAIPSVSEGLRSALSSRTPDLANAVSTVETFDASGPADDLVVQRMTVPPGREYDVAMLLSAQPGVVYVEPNAIVYAADFTPGRAAPPPGFSVNDPLYDQQWHHQRVNMSRAWQLAYDSGHFAEQGQSVRVAVIDSGIDATHPEFAGRIVENKTYYPDVTTVDDCGHGTHIAGLIAASLNNATGGTGAAPNVLLDVRRALYALGNGCTGSMAAVVQAISDTVAAGADIINMSLETSSDSLTLRQIIAYADSQGVMLVAAAGNGNLSQIAYPARYPQVIAVGALTLNDTRAAYSNRGPEMDIAAPGGSSLVGGPIYSTWSRDATARCTFPVILPGALPPYYCTQSGTSQATGIVSGAAALLYALKPSITVTEARSILIETATPIGLPPEVVGAGKLNAEAAVRMLLPPDLKPSPGTITVDNPAGAPYTQTIRVENSSLQPLTWTATLNILASLSGQPLDASPAISLTGGITGTQGVISYGKPAFLTLRIDPALLADGSLSADIRIATVDEAGTARNLLIPIATRFAWLPLARSGAPSATQPSATQAIEGAPSPAFEWLEPASPLSRTVHAMAAINGKLVTLPFPINVDGVDYSDLRLYPDGFVTLPGSAGAPAPGTVNNCLPDVPSPQQAVYGWWADLDAAATGATVSTFPLGERFVVEYADLPSVGAAQPYTVSFQIVLGTEGGVQLNYLDVPDFVGRPERATVGVESTAGRYYSQVACVTEEFVYSELPQSEQTIRITPGEIF